VVAHLGETIESGHFITYLFEDGKLYKYDDDFNGNVVFVTDDVNNIPFKDMRILATSSYMLFYDFVAIV
jgi:ubiquitin C-terminal hydrolase